LQPQLQQAANTLIHAGVLGKSNALTYSPYPGPNEANLLAKDFPQVGGPDQVRARAGYVYPRITADC
jgi:hypothetical protein